MDDKAALKDIRKGGQEGYSVLYKHYVSSLRYHLIGKYRIPEKSVDDVLQDIFLKFFKSIPDFKENCSVSTWLYWQIIPRAVSDFWRKNDDSRLESIEQHPENEDGDEGGLLDNISQENSKKAQIDLERQMCLEQVFALLKRDSSKSSLCECLKALTLQAQGLSIEEIAKQIGRTPVATRSYVYSCKKKLSQYQPLQDCWK
ncbi:hypothetical protein PN36_18150 [Candidatus Thiomargarita nelsonii]|uniref:RNA polymerase sigma-70 region 2 domain-containing protein n=1 Tax=Candidatus Thiomargarita nelsonii TaxID=1003181 RepID=A0A0A6P569_9GAMM|nr:hypothetical protein PN36_18150 [Candidatus Thiomargarita nelsonii]